jgi:hypothetical protein
MARGVRKSEINQRRHRKQKLSVLRKKYTEAKNEAERAKVLERVKKVRPLISVQAFLAPLEKAATRG